MLILLLCIVVSVNAKTCTVKYMREQFETGACTGLDCETHRAIRVGSPSCLTAANGTECSVRWYEAFTAIGTCEGDRCVAGTLVDIFTRDC